ncbi:Hypothetical predicted protein [Octopus vulgaris]|uniref:Uncharacterized protein n=1 Tax=Octopus vulgaris TaxID=6645 RepID=A0AA36F1Q5_OCTVU|nr:Hypothetical predicted protein [Octopus vulgaris]
MIAAILGYQPISCIQYAIVFLGGAIRRKMDRQNKIATVTSMDEGCDKTGRCSKIEQCPENHICRLCTKLENSKRNRWVECDIYYVEELTVSFVV